MAIRFYRTGETPYGCFSNFSAHPFMLDGVHWPTSEHYFQAQKFDWEQVKDDVMRRAVHAKFAQYADIRILLLGTGDEEIIEDAPNDYYRGCGADGTGKNMLGIILMEVRDALRHGVSSHGES